ncbi:MAG: 2,3-bisphosphoglycerate-independent phosphoglycerate mutase [Rickettsiales bacterium]
MKKPIVLCILDGWGESAEQAHNAIAQARTPHWDSLRARWPFGVLHASESHVGLPAGQMGNSEVGHMNIGAGRIVMQDLPRIDAAIADGTLAQNAALLDYIAALKQSGGTCHLLGLLSDGGVHSHIHHVMTLANVVAEAGVAVAIHAFTDGRDVAPKSAQQFFEMLQQNLHKNARIVTISGRYFAMDRDQRWERVERAFRAIVCPSGEHAATARDAVNQAYAANLTDEFIRPTVIGDYAGVNTGDGLLMANFRADRARQLLHTLLDATFDGFAREHAPKWAATLGLVEYSAALNPLIPSMFRPQALAHNLGEWVAQHGLQQLRIAETEKYAHVTFFFNGGCEEPFVGESRILVPSPKVATYDLQPEMSAPEVTDKLVAAIASGQFDFIVVNYANTDMVGHSGDLAAAMQAVEAVDACLGRVSDAVLNAGGAMLITADHGNAECLHDDDSGQAHTAHTLNPVPCVLVGVDGPKSLRTGILADIAPTLCQLLHITPPPEMTGKSLRDA